MSSFNDTLVTVCDIFMKFYKNEYQIKTVCLVQEWLFPIFYFLTQAPWAGFRYVSVLLLIILTYFFMFP